MSNRTALILAGLAGLLTLLLALAPARAEYIYRHRIGFMLAAATTADGEGDESSPWKTRIAGLPGGIEIRSSWSAAEWQTFDALDGTIGDLEILFTLDSPAYGGNTGLRLYGGAPIECDLFGPGRFYFTAYAVVPAGTTGALTPADWDSACDGPMAPLAPLPLFEATIPAGTPDTGGSMIPVNVVAN